jgi:plasmid stabilization system protein ParE
MNYYFEEHARAELRDAVAYYEAIGSELGSSFSAAVENAISLIRQFPNAWPRLSATTRRCRTKRFPYGIIYRIRNDEIEILAVAHFSRRPNYWVDRL